MRANEKRERKVKDKKRERETNVKTVINHTLFLDRLPPAASQNLVEAFKVTEPSPGSTGKAIGAVVLDVFVIEFIFSFIYLF